MNNPNLQVGKLRLRQKHASLPKVNTELAAEPGQKMLSPVSTHCSAIP